MQIPKLTTFVIFILIFPFLSAANSPELAQDGVISEVAVEVFTVSDDDLPQVLRASPDPIEIQLDDLKAQERMATATESMDRATQRMSLYALISTVAVIATVGLLFWTLRETRKVTRLTNELNLSQKAIGESSTKAYISGEGCTLFMPEADGRNARLKITFRNSGQTPALRIECLLGTSHKHHHGRYWSEASGVHSNACPGQSSVTVGTHMQNSKFSEMMLKWEQGMTIGPHVSGTVFYEDIYGNLYRSTFAFLLEVDAGSQEDPRPCTSMELPKRAQHEVLFELAPEEEQDKYRERRRDRSSL